MNSNTAPVRVLVVEDEPAIRRFLRMSLRAEGYDIIEIETGEAALTEIGRRPPDLVVLDLGLPGIDGLEVIRRVRESGSVVPFVVLTSRADEAGKVEALDLGADDHRLQQEGERPIFRSGDLSVDLVRRIVTVRGEEIKLSPREYELLRLLIAHAGKVLTHRLLLKEVWGGDTDVQYLRIYIRHLRQKIELDPERPSHIITETGVGYRLRMLG
jgi:two-component system KDP operon response regulator KdpE